MQSRRDLGATPPTWSEPAQVYPADPHSIIRYLRSEFEVGPRRQVPSVRLGEPKPTRCEAESQGVVACRNAQSEGSFMDLGVKAPSRPCCLDTSTG